jgi:hypothetical protein
LAQVVQHLANLASFQSPVLVKKKERERERQKQKQALWGRVSLGQLGKLGSVKGKTGKQDRKAGPLWLRSLDFRM